MRRRLSIGKCSRRLAALSAAMLGIGVTAGVSTFALASEDTNKPTPTVVSGGTTLFTAVGVSANWDVWVTEFAGLLPDGFELPAAPTAFFETDDEHEFFEDGLPQAVLSRIARCAWLEVALDGSAPRTDTLEARAQLAQYAEYPGIAAGLDVPAYEREIREAASEYGVTAEQWEHEIECDFVESMGAQR